MSYYKKNMVIERNIKYKKKYNQLKRFIKNIVFENAALCDQVSLMQERILIVKEERRFLLKKLLVHAPEAEILKQQEHEHRSPSPANDITNFGKKIKKRSNSDAKPRQRSNKSSEKKVAQRIPLDGLGRPVFPLELGRLTIHSLGEVVSDRPAYHTTDCIYPVGFVSTRVYGSQRDPERKVTYTCKISDGGDVPRFEIVADSDPDSAIVGHTLDFCHGILLQRIFKAAALRNADYHQPNGAAFFGLSNPTVLNLIQSLIRVRKCQNYKWSKFELTHEPMDNSSEDNNPMLSFEALQSMIFRSTYHTVPEIKEEPPDELLDQSVTH